MNNPKKLLKKLSDIRVLFFIIIVISVAIFFITVSVRQKKLETVLNGLRTAGESAR